MTWSTDTYRAMIQERMDRYLREAARDRLAAEMLAQRPPRQWRSFGWWGSLWRGLTASLPRPLSASGRRPL
jgi:hypothetical protein